MNTKLIAALSLLAATSLPAASPAAPAAACCVPAEPVAKAACCAPAEPVAQASCCAEEKADAPLTAESMYQLDSTWTNDAGETSKLAALRGRPVVLAMFFAQCEYACPVIVNDIVRLRTLLPEAARKDTQIVLVTFDTERDTPAALKAFRGRMGLDESWTLLRAEGDAVRELAMLLGVRFKKDARGQFAHSNLLTILNAEGEIVTQHAGLNTDVSEPARVLAGLTR